MINRSLLDEGQQQPEEPRSSPLTEDGENFPDIRLVSTCLIYYSYSFTNLTQGINHTL